MTVPVVTPTGAIRDILIARRRAMTTRALTDALCALSYRWPGRDWPYPSCGRVRAALVAMERRGQVTRVPGARPTEWRLA